MDSSVRRQPTRAFVLVSALALACVVTVPLVAQKKGAAKKPAPAARSRALPSARALPQPARRTPGSQDQDAFAARERAETRSQDRAEGPRVPREHRLRRGGTFDGDLRTLPQTR